MDQAQDGRMNLATSTKCMNRTCVSILQGRAQQATHAASTTCVWIQGRGMDGRTSGRPERRLAAGSV